MTNTLKDSAEAMRLYDEYHAAVWPEVLDDNLRAGINAVYIFRAGRRLFMLCETDGVDPSSLDSLAQSERSREWQDLMKSLFVTASDGVGSSGWTMMKEVMAFNSTESY